MGEPLRRRQGRGAHPAPPDGGLAIPGPGRRIGILGWYGHDNLGDEAILAVLVDAVRRRGMHPVVLSDDPARTARLHGVEAVLRPATVPTRAQRRALKGLDGLLVGGGGFLTDDPLRGLVGWLAPAILVGRRGKPVAFLGVGVPRLQGRAGKALARLAVAKAASIAVRDAGSKAKLVAAGMPEGRIEVAPDLAFAAPAPARRAGPKAGHTGRIGLALAPYLQDDADGRKDALKAALARFMELAAPRAPGGFVFFCMQEPLDREWVREVVRADASITVAPPWSSPSDLAGFLGGCDALVAMRLHSLVGGALAGVPVVPLAYDRKVAAIAQDLGLADLTIEHYVWEPGLQPLDPAVLLARVEAAAAGRTPDPARLKDLRARAQAALDAALDAMEAA